MRKIYRRAVKRQGCELIAVGSVGKLAAHI
jgi:hypothetical protein